MTEAMPFLRKLILLSYDPRPCIPVILFFRASAFTGTNWWDWSGR